MPEPRLRIGLLTHSVNPRGGVVHTLELARALHDLGHAVTVFAPAAAGQRLFRDVPFTVDLVPVASSGRVLADRVGARIAALRSHLGATLEAAGFDVLHAQDPIGANALADLQAAGAIDGFFRTVHHLDHFDDPRLAAWQTRGFSAARQVFCVSRVWCDRMAEVHGIDAALVSNGVDLHRFARSSLPGDRPIAERLGLRPGAPVFLSVGGVEERKNSVRLLQAFVQVRQGLPQAQLVVAGGASLLDHDDFAAEFRQVASAAGLASSDRLLLTGPVADADMPALFRLVDVLALPSLREGFGLVVLEALACGTPVVASAIAPFTEYLTDADCCWADPLDVDSIADAMRRALAPARAAALARETPEVCLRFSWPASAARHLALYRRRLPPALAARPAPRRQPEGCVPCP